MQAFYDSLVGDLTLPLPCYFRVIRVLREVRDGIAEISTSRNAEEIKEIIDIERFCMHSVHFCYKHSLSCVLSNATVYDRRTLEQELRCRSAAAVTH